MTGAFPASTHQDMTAYVVVFVERFEMVNSRLDTTDSMFSLRAANRRRGLVGMVPVRKIDRIVKRHFKHYLLHAAKCVESLSAEAVRRNQRGFHWET